MIGFDAKNKAEVLLFKKFESNIPVPLSDVEQDGLLKANKSNSTWTKSNTFSDAEWTRDDGIAFAYYYHLKCFFSVVTKEYALKCKAAQDAKERKGIEGF